MTVGKAIKLVLPHGSVWEDDWTDWAQDLAERISVPAELKRWAVLPVFSFDVFAVCGHLISESGVVGYFDPNPHLAQALAGEKGKSDKSMTVRFTLTQTERENARKFGEAWLETGSAPWEVQTLWTDLLASAAERLRASLAQIAGVSPHWWRVALQLLIISDEASKGVGFERPSGPGDKRLPITFTDLKFAEARKEDREINKSPQTLRMGRQVATLATVADADVVSVQPKSRVTGIGCTLRNLSRNLALTGSAGKVRCHWQQLITKPKSEDDKALDILVVPLPYEIKANWIRPVQQVENGETVRPGWDNFEIDQRWLKDEKGIVKDVVDLVVKAKEDIDNINAVVFPEYSLNFDVFQKICYRISEVEPDIEFVISGSSSNCEYETANNVMTAVWERSAPGSKIPQRRRRENVPIADQARVRITSQRKHHRWRLNKSQIADYALASTLNPKIFWWESHNIGQRELNFFQFRESSVFSSLICEDLARSDPCHEILRSIGPNLVFSLLMDGPQIPVRWSSRYAGGLSDDPGCSVLTLTSYGLIKRLNENQKYQHSDTIGLWRDESGAVVEIKLKGNAKAVLISLSSVDVTDRTIDGRINRKAKSWRFNSQRPIM
jgi:hypothetical protein